MEARVARRSAAIADSRDCEAETEFSGAAGGATAVSVMEVTVAATDVPPVTPIKAPQTDAGAPLSPPSEASSSSTPVSAAQAPTAGTPSSFSTRTPVLIILLPTRDNLQEAQVGAQNALTVTEAMCAVMVERGGGRQTKRARVETAGALFETPSPAPHATRSRVGEGEASSPSSPSSSAAAGGAGGEEEDVSAPPSIDDLDACYIAGMAALSRRLGPVAAGQAECKLFLL